MRLINFLAFCLPFFVLPASAAVLYVNLNSVNPLPPYAGWDTAATNIQDAIDAAGNGDQIWVTNGIYQTGGRVMAGDLTNRVALNKAVTVRSVNGYSATVIQGAWDQISTNGPGAARCAWLTNGAILSGFTLQNGATRATGDFNTGGPLESGGGVWCASSNGVVANCVLSNNSAIYGGGFANGTLNNSLVVRNMAVYGGGAYAAILNNCTVLYNGALSSIFDVYSHYGAGTYNCWVRNSIVLGNAGAWPYLLFEDNYYYDSFYHPSALTYFNSCTYPLILGNGNFDGSASNPQILDLFHIAATSPCRGTGNALYASGTDLDGEPWANPPSMGCDEVVMSDFVGSLSVGLAGFRPGQTNVLVNRAAFFRGSISGRASYITWSFGDGPTFTNLDIGSIHQWTNAGNYTVTFTAYNNDNPAGVSTNIIFPVLPLNIPQLQSARLLTNGFQFQFAGQGTANYTIQCATNLIPPVSWQTLQTIYNNAADVVQITDPTWTNAARFYRVLAQ